MKKPFLFIAFIIGALLFTTHADAQFIGKAGFNSSNWRISAGGVSVEFGSVAGFNVGGMYRTPISSKFFLTPGMELSTKGAELSGDIFGGGLSNDEFKVTTTHLDIPILFTYQSNPAKGFFVEAGPYFSLLLAAKAEGEDVKEGFNSTDVGISFGLGYDFGNFLLGLRGNNGLSNISDDTDFQDLSFTSFSGQLFGGYKF